MAEPIRTSTSVYTVRPDGIIVQRVMPGARQELRDAQENMDTFLRLAAGQRCLLLVDLRESGPTGAGVREHYAKHAAHILASALIVGSSLSQMIGNFFINLNRPPTPCRLFTSEAQAIFWLRTHAPGASAAAG